MYKVVNICVQRLLINVDASVRRLTTARMLCANRVDFMLMEADSNDDAAPLAATTGKWEKFPHNTELGAA